MRISISKRSLVVRKTAAVALAALVPALAILWLARSGGESTKAPSTARRAPPRSTPAARSAAAPGSRAAPKPPVNDQEHEHDHEIGKVAPLAPPPPPSPEKRRAWLSRLASDPEAAQAAFDELLEDEEALADPDLAAALLALAADRRSAEHTREHALDLVGRSHAADEKTVARLRDLALSNDLGAEARSWAVAALTQIASDRPELESSLRPLLLDVAAAVPNAQSRAIAVDAISTKDASPADVARTSHFLNDPEPEVRASAAHALASSPAASRHDVAASIERALQAESDESAAAAFIVTALEVGRADAAALLGRLASAPIVTAHPELAKQIADYRAALAAGETSVEAILKAHEDR